MFVPTLLERSGSAETANLIQACGWEQGYQGGGVSGWEIIVLNGYNAEQIRYGDPYLRAFIADTPTFRARGT